MRTLGIPFLLTFWAAIALGQPAKPVTNDWAMAEAAMTKHLQRIDPNMRHAEYKSPLLRRYLPDRRIFVRYDRHYASEVRIFVLNQRGEITPLPHEEWRSNAEGKEFQVASVAAFLRSCRIAVTNAASAVDVARLFEEIQGAANYVAFLWINTNEFKSFDRGFMESQYGPRQDWRYTGTPTTNGWQVKVEYVGPPASIRQPPTYRIDLDDQQRFQNLRDN